MEKILNHIKKLPTGRIGRLRLFLGSWLITIMCWSIIFFLGYLLSVFKFSDENMYQRIPLSIFVLILLIFVTYSTVSLSIRRYHDLGKSGWNVLWYFVPLANIIFCLSLLFVSGDEKENQYGAPPDNSKSFLADIFNL